MQREKVRGRKKVNEEERRRNATEEGKERVRGRKIAKCLWKRGREERRVRG